MLNNVHSLPVKTSPVEPCSTFIDGLIMSQRFRKDSCKVVTGLRSIAFRQPGDIGFDGQEVVDQDVMPEKFRAAWIHGSHNTKVPTQSDGTLVQIKGNPGRFNRSDNVFNLGWDDTFAACNRILNSRGLPSFEIGEPAASTQLIRGIDGGFASRPEFAGYLVDHNDDLPCYQGARVWSAHVTRNFIAGSDSDAVAVLNWLDSQSVARVKKKRFGKSTVTWGSLNYCQVEAYLKADEMLDHCRGDIERQAMLANPVYQWARENGLVRVEVKAAKDYLRDVGLTWAGEWNMSRVIKLFDDRTEILHRVKTDIEEFDPASLPSGVACTAAAWLRGENVQRIMKRSTFFRHAKTLREYGIDIAETRNVQSMPVRVKTIELQAAAAPDWYWHRSAA